MKFFKYKYNNFYCEGVKVKDICKNIKTPFYLYSENALRYNYKVLQSLLKNINSVIAFSVKANSNISILKTLADCGAGADIVSIGELKKSIIAGIPPSKIVYSGVGKNNEEIAFALEKKIEQFNVESTEELETISKIAVKKNVVANIALRVNPDISAGGHPKISTGKKTDKFGISIKEAKDIYNKSRFYSNINIKGIDIHIGSQILSTQPFQRAFNKVLSFCKELEKEGHKIENIDLGGGVGIDYDKEEQSLLFLEQYVSLIRKTFKNTNKKIILEPGRFLVANTGILVTSVLYKKITEGKNFLIIDAGMNDLMRPALYDAKHNIKPLVKSLKKETNGNFEVVGTICETADVMIKNAKIPKSVKQGDLYFIEKVGAYGYVMASNYNSKGLASEVLVNKNNYFEVKKRIEIEDFISFEKTAPWLKKS
ncbi:MAG: diaminopimelate decarboxylase [Rickettsiales bacterium]|nr:diaminopimelate decarboxylase [Rickettsiales bacterium]OUV82150.1 MAG: diaminopimelate decarboxylase [Rickettsiales bacterium TMED131]|tara:strand:+ start:660 stop:1937 length:1278 start_codon:yes stop_codon:yes gene_type:complete